MYIITQMHPERGEVHVCIFLWPAYPDSFLLSDECNIAIHNIHADE